MFMIKKLKIRVSFKFYKFLSIFFKVMTIRTSRGSFKLSINTENEVHRAITFNNKEPETIQWIDEFNKKNGNKDDFVFFDVGANIGIYSLYTSKSYPNAKIFAFEPDSQSFSSLCKNIYINKFNIHPYQFAISNASGIGAVRLSSMNAGAGACSFEGDYKFIDVDRSKIFEQGIFFCSLDELVTKYGLPIPNYLKIDVDGIESTILKGSEMVLRSNQCRGILVEFQYKNYADLDLILSYLSNFGFSISRKSEWISEYGLLRSQNFIFIKNI